MTTSPQHPADGKILYVDKDDSMRQLMKMALCNRFHLIIARSAEEGLVLVESGTPYDIIISDFALLWMNGMEFLRRVGEKHPDTVRILMSGGCGDVVDIPRAINEGHISRYVSKPFCMITFLDQLSNDIARLRTIRVAT